jgi:hypothetical protein
MASLVATADPTTGTIRVDVEQTEVRDLFTRVVANGWGTATTGQTWTTVGGVAGDYAVNGTQGTHTFSATNAPRRTRTAAVVDADMGVSAQCTIAVAALTQPIEPGVFVRYTDSSNHYFVNVSLAPSGVATMNLCVVALGVTTVLASVVLGQTHAAGATWLFRLEVCGHLLSAKAWRSTVTEPGWIAQVTDFSLTSGTNIGCRSVLATGNTNGSTVFAYDNLVTYVSQPIRLWRVLPDGTKTEVRGSPGFTEPATAAAATATATFYDNEAPFDVNVFYELTSACNTVVEATSNTVNLASDGDGWLRDPVDPTRNLRIVMEDFFDECVDEDVIVFSGLGSREFANASGIFDIVDDRRPVTVSQTRKNYGSVLTLTSYSLDDIDGIEDILDPGRILLLSLPVVYGFGHRSNGTDYITIYDVTQSLIGVDQQVSARVWTLPFRLSYEPADTSEGGTGGNGIGGAGATYDDLAASVLGLTYNSLTASGETYLQVAQGVGY